MIKELLNKLHSPSKEYTVLLKDFVKRNSKGGNGWTVELDYNDARNIFTTCIALILDKLQNNITKYNALRIMKFSLSNKKLLLDIYEDVVELVKYCLLNETGNVLLELEHLVKRFTFYVDCATNRLISSRTKKQQETYNMIFPKIADLYVFLQHLDRRYQEKNQDHLDDMDLNIEGRFVYSGDTKDKFLKHIRRVVEIINCGTFEQQMQDAGYASIIFDDLHEDEYVANMLKLSQEQKDKLRGETGPYSEIKLIKETRILDDRVSRNMMYVEGVINPLTFEIVESNQDRFDTKYGVKDMITSAEYRGQSHGYIVALSPYIQYDESNEKDVEEQIELFRQNAEEFFIHIHKFVMNLLNIRGKV